VTRASRPCEDRQHGRDVHVRLSFFRITGLQPVPAPSDPPAPTDSVPRWLQPSTPAATRTGLRYSIGVVPNNSSAVERVADGVGGCGTMPTFAPVLSRTTPRSVGLTLPLPLTSLKTVYCRGDVPTAAVLRPTAERTSP